MSEEVKLKSLFPLIDNFERIFEPYLNKFEPLLEEHLRKVREPFEDILHLLNSYYLFLNCVADLKVMSGTHQGVLLLASKIASDLNAIHSCLCNGCIHQASVILRSLFETAVSTKFIYKNYPDRIDIFYNFKYIEQYWKWQEDKSIILPYRLKEIEKKYYLFNKNYIKRKPWYYKILSDDIKKDANLSSQKKKPNLYTMSYLVGMEVDYHKVYNSLSLSVHGSPVLDHLFVSNGNFTAGPVFQKDIIITTAGLSIVYANSVLKTLLSNVDNKYVPMVMEYSEWINYTMLTLAKMLSTIETD